MTSKSTDASRTSAKFPAKMALMSDISGPTARLCSNPRTDAWKKPSGNQTAGRFFVRVLLDFYRFDQALFTIINDFLLNFSLSVSNSHSSVTLENKESDDHENHSNPIFKTSTS
jgi:hypothetical protein